MLCGCEIAVLIHGPNDKSMRYSNTDFDGMISKYNEKPFSGETKTNDDVLQLSELKAGFDTVL